MLKDTVFVVEGYNSESNIYYGSMWQQGDTVNYEYRNNSLNNGKTDTLRNTIAFDFKMGYNAIKKRRNITWKHD